ncbi:DUF3310 domain-containing protein [Listeria cossartiae subsp. cayugensis]|uniref:DUF3310 domain-containing protein n=1 Tax=Listeria cossartiae subsp. cayugensis TaxID=2713505 RepID=A0ABU2IKA9_9LIST|nr:DUF3310 domain-containing protein [Listeria cossartiae]MDT0064620.1 DUF3310 domain-containing protein [Listeria cossartiae subsp. cayugensis]MDT0079776.1 DUF3310 domain-containing protein [Listeria cossartiae subsp. cayugensis]MDT0082612.1 DUF3310 domain-containing protein [Listeria cossartiae subsp. cayugensis]MDT0086853.1 DUF3310 domain-containing protein [Listeria cossartiae subsp. cayugensis]MDT0099229.1 DUF3310 domain-containing protein [Listeria cossartiae subsp. cayugensis]
MKLYHTETQEDYDALMAELEEEGYKWNEVEKATENNAWYVFEDNTVVVKECDTDLGVASKGYCERIYIDTPIEKYKAKTDDVEKWAKHAAEITKRWFAEGAPVSKVNNDNVNNPAHYTSGGIETLDYIKAKVKDYPSYAAGNIIKYVSRYEHKNGIEDLKKAQAYLNDLVSWIEGE